MIDENTVAETVEELLQEVFGPCRPADLPTSLIPRFTRAMSRLLRENQEAIEAEKELVLEHAAEYISDDGDFELLYDELHESAGHRRCVSSEVVAIRVPLRKSSVRR